MVTVHPRYLRPPQQKRNPNETTLRDLNALKARVAKVERALEGLAVTIGGVQRRLAIVAQHVDRLEQERATTRK